MGCENPLPHMFPTVVSQNELKLIEGQAPFATKQGCKNLCTVRYESQIKNFKQNTNEQTAGPQIIRIFFFRCVLVFLKVYCGSENPEAF